jgi:nickel superoxide dismutase
MKGEHRMKNIIKFSSVLILLLGFIGSLHSHCQIPCGIYDDHVRLTLLLEHITTIEKSMNQINELAKDPGKNINQLVRWVNNKDEHADQFTEIVSYYFLAQRINIKEKSNEKEFADYQKKTIQLHQMIVYAMKCKQTTDLKNVEKLRSLVNEFESMYFSKEEKEHIKEHKK